MSRLRLGIVPAPWQTSVDEGCCDYQYGTGFCYWGASSSYRLLALPLHTCRFATAFHIEGGHGMGTRLSDTTVAIALYQNGEEPVRVADVISNDTLFSQWYVGNYAATIVANSSTSTVYVDDVTVRLP